jgi:hypothetical protein
MIIATIVERPVIEKTLIPWRRATGGQSGG